MINQALTDILRRLKKLERDTGRYKTHDVPSTTSSSYSVNWTAATANPAIGDGTLVGRYISNGKMVTMDIYLKYGTATTSGTGNWSFGIPIQAASNGVNYWGITHIRDSATNSYDRFVKLSAGGTTLTVFTQLDSATNVNSISGTSPITFTTNDEVEIQLIYESI